MHKEDSPKVSVPTSSSQETVERAELAGEQHVDTSKSSLDQSLSHHEPVFNLSK